MSVARCAFYIVICSRNGTLKPYNWKQCWVFFFFLIMKGSCSKHRSFWTVEKLCIFFKILLCNTVIQCFTDNNMHVLNWTKMSSCPKGRGINMLLWHTCTLPAPSGLQPHPTWVLSCCVPYCSSGPFHLSTVFTPSVLIENGEPE